MTETNYLCYAETTTSAQLEKNKYITISTSYKIKTKIIINKKKRKNYNNLNGSRPTNKKKSSS